MSTDSGSAPVGTTGEQLPEGVGRFLFDLLDEIDTANDRAKGNDAAFRQIVNLLHPRRFQVASTDGYNLRWHTLATPSAPVADAGRQDAAREPDEK